MCRVHRISQEITNYTYYMATSLSSLELWFNISRVIE